MFSLIITIISIALVAALALATLYYGGDAFNRGSAGAAAARLINEGQQVNGAVAIYKADLAASSTTAVTDLAGLTTSTPKYLSQVPGSFAGATTIASGKVEVATVAADVCTEVNKRAGHLAADVDGAGEQPGVYGCNTVANTFYYKF